MREKGLWSVPNDFIQPPDSMRGWGPAVVARLVRRSFKRGLLRVIDRHREVKFGSLPNFAIHPQPAAMRLNQVFRYREP